MKNIEVILSMMFLTIASTILVGQNLIKNHSFETAIPYKDKMHLWTLGHKSFDQNMRFWTSPSQGTPDIILNRYRGQHGFKRDQQLKDYFPRTGESMIGMRLYGCDSGLPHCREYIQMKISQSLEKGHCYRYKFYTMPVPGTIKINNIGIGLNEFGTKDLATQDLIDVERTIENHVLSEGTTGEWTPITGEFKSDKKYDFFLIGNFKNDVETEITGGRSVDSYYLFDDISLIELNCTTQEQIANDDPQKITLPNVYFDHDSALLKIGLDNLFNTLKQKEFSKLIIIGYTDSTGTNNYNTNLSLKRAENIMNELISLGISKDKMEAQGRGSSDLISETDLSKNRRVEITSSEYNCKSIKSEHCI